MALSIAGYGLYVAGSTTGELPDGTQPGESDGFLRKYPPNGTQVWTRQFGTADYDAVYGMVSDPREWSPWGPRTERSRAGRTPATAMSSS